jgi:hypothetical protein
MKIMYKYLFLILIVVAISCRPEEFPGVGERAEVVPLLEGTWTVESVIQFDNDAQRKGYPLFAQTQDLTEEFPYDEFSLTLDVDADGEPTTFAISLGDSPNIIGDVATGTWSVDDVNFPSEIVFTDGSEALIKLGSLAQLSSGKLVFKVVRNQLKSGTLVPVVTYNYVLSKTE